MFGELYIASTRYSDCLLHPHIAVISTLSFSFVWTLSTTNIAQSRGERARRGNELMQSAKWRLATTPFEEFCKVNLHAVFYLFDIFYSFNFILVIRWYLRLFLDSLLCIVVLSRYWSCTCSLSNVQWASIELARRWTWGRASAAPLDSLSFTVVVTDCSHV